MVNLGSKAHTGKLTFLSEGGLHEHRQYPDVSDYPTTEVGSVHPDNWLQEEKIYDEPISIKDYVIGGLRVDSFVYNRLSRTWIARLHISDTWSVTIRVKRNGGSWAIVGLVLES